MPQRSYLRHGEIGGSPQTITVTYAIGSSVDVDTATPGVVQSNVGGELTLRSQGSVFKTGDSVTIGATVVPSSSIDYYSDSDMIVSYPPLAAGTYPISVSSGGGSVSYSGTLTVVDPAVYGAGFLAYPGITPTAIQSLQYDAQRLALFVALATDAGPVLLRYAYDGGSWSSQTSVSSLTWHPGWRWRSAPELCSGRSRTARTLISWAGWPSWPRTTVRSCRRHSGWPQRCRQKRGPLP